MFNLEEIMYLNNFNFFAEDFPLEVGNSYYGFGDIFKVVAIENNEATIQWQTGYYEKISRDYKATLLYN